MSEYEGWAIVELMGHRQRFGSVREVEIAGGKMLRVDIPDEGGEVTEFYGTAAIYSLRPASEEIVRDMAKRYGVARPARPVGYRELPAPRDEFSDDADDEIGF